MDVKHTVFSVLACIAFAALLVFSLIDEAHAKGGGAVAARGGGGFSSARPSSSYSSSSSYRSYSSTPARPAAPARPAQPAKPAKSSTWFNQKDDDVECDTLRSSRYASDRMTYKRYC